MPVILQLKRHTGGYALLEIILAFAIAVVILVGVVSLGVSTVRAVTVNRDYIEAGKIAQREVDRLKLYRDSVTWTDFTNTVSSVCLGSCYVDGTALISGTKTQAPVTYYYTISLTPLLPSVPTRADYSVNTIWQVGNQTKTYSIKGTLTNWRGL